MSHIGITKELGKGIKTLFSPCENIFFHNKNYRIKVDNINMEVQESPRLLMYYFSFILETKDENTENILTGNNVVIFNNREGGKISFDNIIYNCFNFNVRKINNEKYKIICRFRIEYINFKRKGLRALIDAGEYYDYNEEINIPFTRFEIMDI